MGFANKGKWQFAYQLCARSDKSHHAYQLYCYLKSNGLYYEANTILQEEMETMVQGDHKISKGKSVREEKHATGSQTQQQHDKGHHVHLWEPVTADELRRQNAVVRNTYLPLPFHLSPSQDNSKGFGVSHDKYDLEKGGILMVDDLVSLEQAAKILFCDEPVKTISVASITTPLRFVSIDAEWRATIPQGGGFHQTRGASILQVAVPAQSPSGSTETRLGACVLIF